MFAKQENFLSLLKASEKLRIPIYQRKYSWNLKQCKELWEDIIEVGKKMKNPLILLICCLY